MKKEDNLSSGRKSVNGCNQRAKSFCSIGDGCCTMALRVNGRSANIKVKEYFLSSKPTKVSKRKLLGTLPQLILSHLPSLNWLVVFTRMDGYYF